MHVCKSWENAEYGFDLLVFRLEDPDAEEVKDFVQKQVDLTESVLKQCETREKLQKKLTELYDYPKYDAPFREGDKFFYFHNTGLQLSKVLSICR